MECPIRKENTSCWLPSFHCTLSCTHPSCNSETSCWGGDADSLSLPPPLCSHWPYCHIQSCHSTGLSLGERGVWKDRSPSCRHICKEPISFHFYKVEYLIKRFYTFWGNWKIIKNFYCECFNITVKYIIPFFLSVLCTKSSGHSADKIFFIMFGNKFTDWMEFSKIYICTAYEIWRYGSKVYFVFEQNINHLLFYVFWGFTKIFRKSRRCFETPFFKQCV